MSGTSGSVSENCAVEKLLRIYFHPNCFLEAIFEFLNGVYF